MKWKLNQLQNIKQRKIRIKRLFNKDKREEKALQVIRDLKNTLLIAKKLSKEDEIALAKCELSYLRQDY
ncbi:hypothetical protein [Helicobacter cetorum]|uniref:hypothetical protein n=1 Tax=Helicobacter cetorum TaxID=138563 RepID=UPI000CF12242|nr:hypothetical protein [Helicobacter cetorum]